MQESNRLQHAPLHLLICCGYCDAAIFGQCEVIQNVNQHAAGDSVLIEQGVILEPVREHKKQP